MSNCCNKGTFSTGKNTWSNNATLTRSDWSPYPGKTCGLVNRPHVKENFDMNGHGCSGNKCGSKNNLMAWTIAGNVTPRNIGYGAYAPYSSSLEGYREYDGVGYGSNHSR